MSTLKTASRIAPSYDDDFHEWAVSQARALRDHRAAELDWDNLAEEIESLGGSDRREVTSRLTTILVHLLKWRYQQERRTDSWSDTIARERMELFLIFEQSPSLARYAETALTKAYRLARAETARQTGLNARSFPADSPFSPRQALDPDFWPGGDDPR